MSATAFFDAARAHKRELTGEPLGALTQDDVDALNAVISRWKAAGEAKAAKPGPKGLGDAQAFYGAVRASFGALSQPQVDGFGTLLQAVGKAGWPLSYVAYALATTWHEVNRTMQPIKELGGPAYFHKMYDIQGNRPKKARELGNLSPGDGAKYAGRGYVQLTGKSNYQKAAAKTGAPLVSNPDLALRPDIAAAILVWGMSEGRFTGKKLADYLPAHGPASKRQFQLARYIINGQDKASPIADYALKFQTALQAGEWA